MGVLGLWSHLVKSGHEPLKHNSPHVTAGPNSFIRIDVASTFQSTIRYAYTKHHNNTLVAHNILEHEIQQIGNKNQIVLYVDGNPALEKHDTSVRREETRRRVLNRAERHLADVENRLINDQRIRKTHVQKITQALTEAFRWTLEHRAQFIEHMQIKGWSVFGCPMEADVAIARDCTPCDLVVTIDSDFLVYSNVYTVYRSFSRGGRRRYLIYTKSSVLNALDLSANQLLVLGIVSRNDYGKNIPRLGITTNRKLIKSIPDADVAVMVQYYLECKSVLRKNTIGTTFIDSLRVFSTLEQTLDAESSPIEPSGYIQLRERFDRCLGVLDQRKKKRQESRTTTAQQPPQAERNRQFLRYRTVDNAPHSAVRSERLCSDQGTPNVQKLRYTAKERHAPFKQRDEPEVMYLYSRKATTPDDAESQADAELQAYSTTEPAKTKQPIKEQLVSASKIDLVRAMAWEHPTVTLDIGTLRANVSRAVDPHDAAVECIQRAVREASAIKRRCQELIGLFLHEVFVDGRLKTEDDRQILDFLCPNPSAIANRSAKTCKPKASTSTTSTKIGSTVTSISNSSSSLVTSIADNKKDSADDDGVAGYGSYFFQSFMAFLHSGRLPRKKEVLIFIRRLQDLRILPTQVNPMASPGKSMFPSTHLVRSVATQLAVEMERLYTDGCNAMSLKLQQQEPETSFDHTEHITIEAFFWYRHLTKDSKWCIVPVSPVADGFMTFSEREVAGLFFNDEAMKGPLLSLVQQQWQSSRPFTQNDVLDIWLQGQEPGVVINHFLCDMSQKDLTVRQRGKAGVAAAVKQLSLQQMEDHVNRLRYTNFVPASYSDKGYALRGSIKTDGYRLQVLAFKLKELQSVRYKRYKEHLIPDRLQSTVGGTDYYLSEVRNVIKSEEDLHRYLGVDRPEAEKVTYLGIDLGQSCVVGACALLPDDQNPRVQRRRRRGSRGGRTKRRKRRRKKTRKCVGECQEQEGQEAGQERHKAEQREQQGARFFNLSVKQKAVYQPTLKHRRWVEQQKAIEFTTIEGQQRLPSPSISSIETSVPPRHGVDADFKEFAEYRSAHLDKLDRFYNGANRRWKKHQWDAQRARHIEFQRIADSLLRMVGGCIGTCRKEEEKVIIGIGLGQFKSNNKLSSLHTSFQSYFVEKARSLNYLVVGVNEFYTSKKCPSCHNFVAQLENMRQLFCPTCKKYFHRDQMAGHNIAKILRAHVQYGERPEYLQPVDNDGNLIWSSKRKAVGRDDTDEDVPLPKKSSLAD